MRYTTHVANGYSQPIQVRVDDVKGNQLSAESGAYYNGNLGAKGENACKIFCSKV